MFKFMPFFNADGLGGGGQPDVSTPPAEATPSAQPTANWGMPNQGNANPLSNPMLQQVDPAAAAPVVAEQAPEVLDFAGRKIPAVDPALKDLHKDFTSLQSTYTKTNQELLELRTRAQIYEQMIQQQQQQPPQMQAQQSQPPSPEELEQAKEDFMNRFYDDPMGTLNELVTSQVKPVVEPITKEREMNAQIQTMVQKYTDFNDMVPFMQSVLEENPRLQDQGLETVYFYAKGKSAQTVAAPPSPEQLMQDPDFVQNYIMNNEQIKNQFINQYVGSVQQKNQNTPPVLGNQAGGSIPSMPESQPKTLSQGSKAFAKYLGL